MTNDFLDLCMACRIGDVPSVDRLLSIGVDPNQTDEFDYTPLFLGSLCGHFDVVKLLLERGAVCDIDKLEGARCVYGALTDQIRNLLIDYDISKAVDANLPFASHLRSLREDVGLVTEDLIIKSKRSDRIWKVHRFMISGRSSWFKEKLQEFKSEVVLELDLEDDIIQNIIDNMYLIHDAFKFDRLDKGKLLKAAKTLELEHYSEGLQQYVHTIDQKDRAKVINQLQITLSKQARTDLQKMVEEVIIPDKIISKSSSLTPEEVQSLQILLNYPDLILTIHDEESDNHIYYPLNRAILTRDHYFKTMFTSSFQEALDYELLPKYQIVDRSNPIPVISLPVNSKEIAEILIRFLYYDDSDIELDLAIDVIYLADLLMNDRLKTMAAVTITSSKDFQPTNEELYEILNTGWQMRIDRLEKFVAQKIALDLDRFLFHDEKFKEIVIESSKRISNRQEFDSIELIDDIRFFLQKKWKIDFEGLFEGEKDDLVEFQPGFQSYQDDLDKIEAFLQDLDLEA